MTTRRNFIKTTCTACFGIAASAAFLESCAPLPVYKTTVLNDKIDIPQTTFLAGETSKIIRAEQLEFDILLVNNGNGNYTALLMKCTHMDNSLVLNKTGLSCNLHGSRFNLEGDVTNGPATIGLQHFKTIASDNQITILLK